jgi:hypothetical protein
VSALSEAIGRRRGTKGARAPDARMAARAIAGPGAGFPATARARDPASPRTALAAGDTRATAAGLAGGARLPTRSASPSRRAATRSTSKTDRSNRGDQEPVPCSNRGQQTSAGLSIVETSFDSVLCPRWVRRSRLMSIGGRPSVGKDPAKSAAEAIEPKDGRVRPTRQTAGQITRAHQPASCTRRKPAPMCDCGMAGGHAGHNPTEIWPS